MQCVNCDSNVDHNIIYTCNNCGTSLCDKHIRTHICNPPVIPPLFQILQKQFQSVPTRREPTNEEYEQYLRSNPQVLTSGRESLDLLGAMLLLFLVFGLRPLLEYNRSLTDVLLLTAVIAPAFILHELAHKYAAIYFGKYARFTLLKQMSLMTLFVAFIGWGIAGPGATMIMGRSDDREKGIFAAAGPGLNFTLACVFYLLSIIVPDVAIGTTSLIILFKFSIYINAFFGLFNLIPVSILDGKKIKDWNVPTWITLVILNLMALIYSFPVLGEINIL